MPLREASSSLSIDLSLSQGPLELLSTMQSHATSLPALTTSLIINCVSGRPNCTGTFQCRSMNEHATPRSLSSEESERGSRSSGCLVVVVVSLFVLLGRCVALRSTPDGGDFGYFGLDSRPRAPPAGQHGPCAEVREVAGLRFPRLHFGGFAPRAWRVSAGRLEKNRGFFLT